MKKRLMATIAAIMIACGMTLYAAAPAQAAQIKRVCFHAENVAFGNDYPWCLSIAFAKLSGDDGFTVYWIELECRLNTWEFGWDHPAVDGHSLKMTKGDGTVLRSWDDAHSNVDTPDGNPFTSCERVIDINTVYPSPHQILLKWDVTLQIDKTVDQNPPVAVLTITNA
jgi:hypothetical protein